MQPWVQVTNQSDKEVQLYKTYFLLGDQPVGQGGAAL